MKKFKSNDGIAGWKFDHPLERLLEKAADKSELGKKLYVWFYATFDKDYYQKGLTFIEKNIANFAGNVTPAEKKKLIVDMVYSLHRFGCPFDEYFLFDYPNLNVRGRDSFITDKLRWGYYSQMNLDENKILFNDKHKAYELFHKFYKRELLEIQDDGAAEAFYAFLQRHPCFIAKPFDGSGGKGIFVVNSNDYADKTELFKMLRQKGHIVVEELIQQAKEMAVFNASSVNTVRVPTLRLRDRVIVYQPFLRTGKSGAIVDNASSGGILAAVDPDTGICFTKGLDENGKSYLRHPESNICYPGFQIPRWEEAVALVTELSAVVSTNHYVGWDIALTDEGWVMIEGNPRGQLLAQYATGKGIKQELEALIQQM